MEPAPQHSLTSSERPAARSDDAARIPTLAFGAVFLLATASVFAQAPAPRERATGVAPPEASSTEAPRSKPPAEPTPVVERAVRPTGTAAPAVDLAPRELAAPASTEWTSTIDRVHYDDAFVEGELWARGATYKAGFQSDGTVYAPYLGAAAPRNHPVTFRVADVSSGGRSISFDRAVEAEREGDIVRYERGAFVELYELAVHSVEQSFVFPALPQGAQGDLVVRLAVETDLARRESAEGLRFENDLGAVRYGRATALDATGASVPAATILTDTGIEIRVPENFVRSARFPLVIDPVVSTFFVDFGQETHYSPEVAYDAFSGRWLVVYEQYFSATDHDVVYRLLDANGASLATGFVELSLSQYWANPSCANNGLSSQFLIAAQVGQPGGGVRTIQGRTISATGTLGGTFVISTPEQSGDKFNPRVGGDPFQGSPTYFCVVWERTFSATDSDIHYRMFAPNGAGIGSTTSFVDDSASTIDKAPSISKSNGSATWNVAWQRQASFSNHDLRGARIAWNGGLANPSFSIDSSSANTHAPSASSSLATSNRWAVAYEDLVSGGLDRDIVVALLDGANVADVASLTGLEALAGSGAGLEDHSGPSIDSNGDSFVVAYSESAQNSASDYDVYVATLAAAGNRLELSEGHQAAGLSGNFEITPAIAARGNSGGGERRAFLAWASFFGGTGGWIRGALYDAGLYTSFCFPGADGTAACPCGNPPSAHGRGCDNSAATGGALLTATGTPSLSADTMQLTASNELATALSIFNQGNAVVDTGVVFGQGLRCVGGAQKRLYIKSASGGTSTAPNFITDLSIHARSAALGDPLAAGSTRAYYVYYRDPVVLGGCSSSSSFNTTQSVQAIWIP